MHRVSKIHQIVLSKKVMIPRISLETQNLKLSDSISWILFAKIGFDQAENGTSRACVYLSQNKMRLCVSKSGAIYQCNLHLPLVEVEMKTAQKADQRREYGAHRRVHSLCVATLQDL